ncbi:MFS transporter [Saccharomonospora sp. CUA-673]|uniref:MFS transporter n=1 Tax=Saccharomonospora sp. CUA-673 TaxID=1904969 RepID=UPI0021006F97|nr:MFS transporter [Saccharomonospora sp. CUA-673]
MWALVADAVPLYPLYALLFADSGLSEAQIAGLLAIWSVSGVVFQVPAGIGADRFSRTGAMALGAVAQASAYVLWTAWPGLVVFAVGFALWGAGASLVSGACEAWLYDSLTELGEPHRFQRLYGRLGAVELLAQIPAAGAATVLLPLGGFELVGWASVTTCLTAAVLAARLPEPARPARSSPRNPSARGTLGAGVRVLVGTPGVRGAVAVVALVTAVDDVEEFFPLLAEQWDVSAQWVPAATLGIHLAGAAGSLVAGRIRDRWTAPLLLAGVAMFAAAGLWADPPALVLVAAFYALYRGVLIVVSARLQDRITDSDTRATVTSVAGVGTDLAGLLLLGAWAAAGLPAALVLTALVACSLPYRGGHAAR